MQLIQSSIGLYNGTTVAAVTESRPMVTKESRNRRLPNWEDRSWVVRWLLPALLIAGIVGSALKLVYQVQETRQVYVQLQKLQKYRNQLDVEWGRLLIEQQAFGAISQISSHAVLNLHMYSPAAHQVIRLDQPASALLAPSAPPEVSKQSSQSKQPSASREST